MGEKNKRKFLLLENENEFACVRSAKRRMLENEEILNSMIKKPSTKLKTPNIFVTN